MQDAATEVRRVNLINPHVERQSSIGCHNHMNHTIGHQEQLFGQLMISNIYLKNRASHLVAFADLTKDIASPC